MKMNSQSHANKTDIQTENLSQGITWKRGLDQIIWKWPIAGNRFSFIYVDSTFWFSHVWAIFEGLIPIKQ